jgi:hypothetical protein
VLTAAEAAGLRCGSLPLTNTLVERVTGLMTNAAIVPQAYARVEDNRHGHPWHFDTGDGGHMPWCRWSASVLLSPPDQFSGGEFQFRDPDQVAGEYLGALIYSSNEEHRVTPHDGVRKVLLIFLGADDGE